MADLDFQPVDDVLVIAEAGVNHNGSEELAHQLIDVAVEAGAQAVKFQTFDPASLTSAAAKATPYQLARSGSSDQSELLANLTLPTDAWKRLKDHSDSVGIHFLSTPFDMGSAHLLVDLGVGGLKVSSGELTNLPMLAELATLGLPLLVSTGMGDAAEVAAAVQACAPAPELVLLHCVSAYPAPLDQCNLRVIPTLMTTHDVPVGWSDHTLGTAAAVAAVTLGARVVEKHYTLDTTMEGPDHLASLEPEALTDYVQTLRAIPVALGDGNKRRMPAEEENAPHVRRSWHATRDLRAGDVLAREDLIALRPEGGIRPSTDIVGQTLASDVAAGDTVRAEAVVGG